MRNAGLIPGILRTLRDAGMRVTEVPTTGPETAGAIARARIAAGSDLILVAGGDGTVNEAIEGMVHSRTPLGVIPAGTANVFANEIGLSSSAERVARNLMDLRPARIALGSLSNSEQRHKHFLLMAGAGLDAYIVNNVNADIKARLGKVAYWLAGFSQVGKRLQEFEVKVGGQTLKASYGLFSRVRNYGGDLEIARTITLLDDKFEVVLFEGPSSFRYLMYLTGVLLNRLPYTKGATVMHADQVELRKVSPGTAWLQVDGETAGELPATIRIVPDALTVLMSARYLARSRNGKN